MTNAITSPPYLINETIAYTCNAGFAAEHPGMLENVCIENDSVSDQPFWLKSEETLSQICRPGIPE